MILLWLILVVSLRNNDPHIQHHLLKSVYYLFILDNYSPFICLGLNIYSCVQN